MECFKLVIILSAAALVLALPRPQQPVPIVKSEQYHGLNGNYSYSYETGDGIRKEEIGYLKNVGQDDEAQVAEGQYSYTHPDGTNVDIKYIADEGGFRPVVKLVYSGRSRK